MLDPDIRRLLDTVFNIAPVAGPPDVAQLRSAAENAPALFGGEPLALASIEDMHVTAAGAAIGLRVYRPSANAAMPLVLYAHGGGWVTGSLESHDRLCRILAVRLQAVVVAVDYRCAPEHVFPTAVDDVAPAWHWARPTPGTSARMHAVRGAGDSSGAFAANLTLRLRAAGAPQPQPLLLYPALDATCSRASIGNLRRLNLMEPKWRGTGCVSVGAADVPAAIGCRQFSGLPRDHRHCENDVLRDDGLAYAQRPDSRRERRSYSLRWHDPRFYALDRRGARASTGSTPTPPPGAPRSVRV